MRSSSFGGKKLRRPSQSEGDLPSRDMDVPTKSMQQTKHLTRLYSICALWLCLITSLASAFSTRCLRPSRIRIRLFLDPSCRWSITTYSPPRNSRVGTARELYLNQDGESDPAFIASLDPTIAPKPYNSFLKVMMDDSVLETLHSLTQQITSSWEDENKESNNKSEMIQIKPRSLESLHMTYFSMGAVLDDMQSQEEMTLWNSMLRQKLCSDTNNRDRTYSLKFKGFDTLPPQRNLFVALFEPSEDLNELYEKLCDLAMTTKTQSITSNKKVKEKKHPYKEYECPMLINAIKREVKRRNKKKHSSPWVRPHVTLGNIVGGKEKGSGICQLGDWLSNQKFSYAGLDKNGVDIFESDIIVQGLELSGQRPPSLDLDWSFPLFDKQ